MPTTLRAPAFKAALQTALQARAGLAGVQVARWWPGPTTASEGIYLGNLDAGELASGRIEPSSIKTGRQRRNDDAEVYVTCQTYRSGPTPLDADDAEARVHALFDEVEGAIADDPGMSATVDWSPGITWRTSIVVFEQGWAVRLSAVIQIHARLT